jgi:hypothetical protein
MELIQINKKIFEVSERIEKSGKELYQLANKKAETEQEYRLALAQEIIKLKHDGMQATLIPDVARGNVSNLKFQRDVAAERLKVATEAKRGLESTLSGLQTIIKYQSDM